jgi:hypothetical protein
MKENSPMSRTKSRLTMFLLVFALLLVPFTAGAQSVQPNTLPDGATYLIEVPANWNGTLLL